MSGGAILLTLLIVVPLMFLGWLVVIANEWPHFWRWPGLLMADYRQFQQERHDEKLKWMAAIEHEFNIGGEHKIVDGWHDVKGARHGMIHERHCKECDKTTSGYLCTCKRCMAAILDRP